MKKQPDIHTTQTVTKGKSSVFALFILLIISAIVFSPFYKPGFIVTDDGDWMIIRLTAFYQALAEGQFPVRYLGRLYNGYGYPVANFLYPGYLYLGSVIHFLGFGYITTVKIILVSTIASSVGIVYLIMRRYFTVLASFVGSLSFLLSPYLLYDLYKRGSVGEFLAIFSVLVCIFSIEYKRSLLLSLGTALLIISHNTLAMFFLPFEIGYLYFLGSASLVKSVILGMFMSAFFWMPALYEQKYVIFRSVTISDPAQYFATAIPWLMGGIGMLVAVMGLVFEKKRLSRTDKYMTVVFGTSLFFASPLSNTFWTFEPFAKLVQFPYRFLALSTISGAWVSASLFQKLKVRAPFLMLLIILWIYSVIMVLNFAQTRERQDAYFATNEATTTIADEYLPVWVNTKVYNRTNELISVIHGSGEANPVSFSSKRIIADMKMKEDSIVQINKLYYPGWGVLIDGQPVRIDYKNNNGFMRLSIPQGNHQLFAEFRETVSRLVADGITIVAWVIFIGLSSIDLFFKKTQDE